MGAVLISPTWLRIPLDDRTAKFRAYPSPHTLAHFRHARIPRVATYRYSEDSIERITHRALRFRMRFCAIAVPSLLATYLFEFYQPPWLPARVLRPYGFVFVNIIFLLPIWNSRNLARTYPATLRHMQIEISSGEIRRWAAPGKSSSLQLNEITRGEEASIGGALYLRTRHRYRWMHVPRDLDGYEALSQELNVKAIPIAPTAIPPNWEEFLGVAVLLLATLVAAFSGSSTLLILDAFVFTIIAFWVFYVVRANPENPRHLLWMIPFIFTPVVVFLLWHATHR